MAVRISPVARQQFFDNQGNVAAGMFLFTYAAGTANKLATYTSSTGGTPNENPIELDSAGRTSDGLWLTDGLLYKFVLAPANDTDPPSSPVWTEDNVASGDASLANLSNTSSAALGDALVGFKQSNSGGALAGAAARTVHDKLQEFVSLEDFGGGASKTAAQNVTAMNAAIDSGASEIRFGTGGLYLFNDQIDLPRDINFVGQHTPGADATNAPTGTRVKRTADVILFNTVGTNRSTDRIGRNRFTGIQFVDDTNISTKAFFNCKYADSLVFEHCTFWQPDGQTSAGHVFDIEECWDWRFWNCIWKHYGNAAGTKHALNIKNGADDNCNGFRFYGCRWQEGLGSALNFAATSGGTNNHDFELHGCKMEDTGNASKSHIADAGTMSDLKIFGGEYAGCGERQISQASGSTRWRIMGASLSNGGASATEMIELLGNRSSVVGCTFQGPGAAVTRYINTTAADCEITGNSRASTVVPLVNTAGVNATTKIHANPDFLTEYSNTAQITSGNTFIDVTHALGYTPAQHHIMVCPHSSLGAAATFWVSNVGATTFRINVNADPTATITFVWWARRQRG